MGSVWEPYDEKARLCRMTLNSKLEKRSRRVCPQRWSRNVNQNGYYTTKKGAAATNYGLLHPRRFLALAQGGHLSARARVYASPAIMRQIARARKMGSWIDESTPWLGRIGDDISPMQVTTIDLRYLGRLQAQHDARFLRNASDNSYCIPQNSSEPYVNILSYPRIRYSRRYEIISRQSMTSVSTSSFICIANAEPELGSNSSLICGPGEEPGPVGKGWALVLEPPGLMASS
ncbi:hypothetical protein HFD88_003069 [Aspergillus terreus]|nr:hypothetical protein HFD88_003069 [Aspergillus terreus]